MLNINEKISVNRTEYTPIKLLGKGKGGYSYLVKNKNDQFVLKQIHHEPCDYYHFGNKIETEIADYHRLTRIGIRVPKLFDVDLKQERIIKEYIEGDLIYDLVLHDQMRPEYFEQIHEMCTLLYAKNTNIDYFPTNFIVQNGLLYYIDFECNDYMEEWNFEKWGIKYWSKTPEFLQYVKDKT